MMTKQLTDKQREWAIDWLRLKCERRLGCVGAWHRFLDGAVVYFSDFEPQGPDWWIGVTDFGRNHIFLTAEKVHP